MSQQSQSVQPQAQTSATLSPEIINALTQTFNEFLETLQALNKQQPPEPNSEPAPDEAPPKLKDPGQIRCYRVPNFIVKNEQEALEQYNATDLLDFLQKAREHIYITSYLLRNFNDYEDVTGFTLNQIGEHFEHPLAMLNRLCSILADFNLQAPEPGLDC